MWWQHAKTYMLKHHCGLFQSNSPLQTLPEFNSNCCIRSWSLIIACKYLLLIDRLLCGTPPRGAFPYLARRQRLPRLGCYIKPRRGKLRADIFGWVDEWWTTVSTFTYCFVKPGSNIPWFFCSHFCAYQMHCGLKLVAFGVASRIRVYLLFPYHIDICSCRLESWCQWTLRVCIRMFGGRTGANQIILG